MSEPSARTETGRDSLAELFTGSSNFVERLPMLRVAFERAAAACTEDLAAVARAAAAGDAAGHRKRHRRRPAGCPRRQERRRRAARRRSGTPGLLASADRGAVFAIVETMLGGDGSQPAARAGSAAFAHRDARCRRFLRPRRQGARSGVRGSSPNAPLPWKRLSDEIDFDVIGRRNNPVVVARFRLEVSGRGGEIADRGHASGARIRCARRWRALLPRKRPPPMRAGASRCRSGVTRAHVMLTRRARRAHGHAGRGCRIRGRPGGRAQRDRAAAASASSATASA